MVVVLIHGVSAVLFTFFLWRRARQDYTSTQIFNTAVLIILSAALGWAAFRFTHNHFTEAPFLFNPKVSGFWYILAFGTAGFFLSVRWFLLNPYEALEALFPGVLLWFLLISIAFFDLMALFAAVSLALFYYLERVYPRILWYRSGKVGFASLVSAATFFGLRAGGVFINSQMFTSIGRIDAPISAAISFILLFVVYNRR